MAKPALVTEQDISNGATGPLAEKLYTYRATIDPHHWASKKLEEAKKAGTDPAKALSDEEKRRLAAESLDQAKKFITDPQHEILLTRGGPSNLQEKLSLESLKDPETKEALNSLQVNVEALEGVTDPRTRTQITKAINNGIKKAHNDWFSWFGDLVMGFLTWLGSGFSGGFGGLQQIIGERITARTENAVEQELDVLAKNNPGNDMLQGFIANHRGDIRRTIHEKGMDIARGKPVSPAETEARLIDKIAHSEIQPSYFNATPEQVKAGVLGTIHTEVEAAFKGDEAKKKIGKLFENIVWANSDALQKSIDTNITTIANTMNNTLQTIVQNKEPLPRDIREARATIHTKLAAAFRDMKVRNEKGTELTLEDWYKNQNMAKRSAIAAQAGNPSFSGKDLPDYLAAQITSQELLSDDKIRSLQLGNFIAGKGFVLGLPDKLKFGKDIRRMLGAPVVVRDSGHGLDSNPPPPAARGEEPVVSR